jgi:hypothetical protein
MYPLVARPGFLNWTGADLMDEDALFALVTLRHETHHALAEDHDVIAEKADLAVYALSLKDGLLIRHLCSRPSRGIL